MDAKYLFWINARPADWITLPENKIKLNIRLNIMDVWILSIFVETDRLDIGNCLTAQQRFEETSVTISLAQKPLPTVERPND